MRVHMHVEQPSVTEIIPVLWVNGHELKLSKKEFDDLTHDIMFVRGAMAAVSSPAIRAYQAQENWRGC